MAAPRAASDRLPSSPSSSDTIPSLPSACLEPALSATALSPSNGAALSCRRAEAPGGPRGQSPLQKPSMGGRVGKSTPQGPAQEPRPCPSQAACLPPSRHAEPVEGRPWRLGGGQTPLVLSRRYPALAEGCPLAGGPRGQSPLQKPSMGGRVGKSTPQGPAQEPRPCPSQAACLPPSRHAEPVEGRPWRLGGGQTPLVLSRRYPALAEGCPLAGGPRGQSPLQKPSMGGRVGKSTPQGPAQEPRPCPSQAACLPPSRHAEPVKGRPWRLGGGQNPLVLSRRYPALAEGCPLAGGPRGRSPLHKPSMGGRANQPHRARHKSPGHAHPKPPAYPHPAMPSLSKDVPGGLEGAKTPSS